MDWFGQLQAVDLESIQPSLRAGMHLGGIVIIVIIDYCLLASLDLLEFGKHKAFSHFDKHEKLIY